MSELLPCPYCGNEFPTITGTQSKGVLIRCPQCNTTFSRDFYETGRGELGKQRTIEAWNRRAQPADEPLVRCGECAKYQSPQCAAKHEQALMDFCSHGIRKPGGGQT